MRKNWKIRIVGEKVILVPYRHAHVERYHKWMQDEYLQEMTASEPLTLEEEYKMIPRHSSTVFRNMGFLVATGRWPGAASR